MTISHILTQRWGNGSICVGKVKLINVEYTELDVAGKLTQFRSLFWGGGKYYLNIYLKYYLFIYLNKYYLIIIY